MSTVQTALQQSSRSGKERRSVKKAAVALGTVLVAICRVLRYGVSCRHLSAPHLDRLNGDNPDKFSSFVA